MAKKNTMELDSVVVRIVRQVFFQEKQMVIESASLECVTMESILTWQAGCCFKGISLLLEVQSYAFLTVT